MVTRLLLLFVLLCFVSVVASGAVAAQETVSVSDADGLDSVRDDLDGDYVLVGDIDMSDEGSFEPIGDRDEPFTGSFDGGGNVIEGLTVVRPNSEEVGLFGALGDGARVRDVGLEDVDVTGGEKVGGIAGFSRGNVTRSYVTGQVSGEGDDVGGVIGWQRYGNIANSYSKADVSGSVAVGGVVGFGTGTIELTYAAGSVSPSERSGGVVGQLGSRHQLAGRESVLRDSYYDTSATRQNDAVGYARSGAGETNVENVEGLPTEEMQGSVAEENMQAFDFVNTWETSGEDYPVLAWQTGVLTGDGAPLPTPGFGFVVGFFALLALLSKRLLRPSGG